MPHSQGPCNNPYHEQNQHQFLILLPFPLRFILILSSHLRLGLPKGLFPPSALRRIAVEGGAIWANSALMNLWIVCHDGYRYTSLQEDVLLGIRGTGVYCNLHNF